MAFVLLLAAGVLITTADATCSDGEGIFAPSLSCSGSCPCTPWVGLNESTIFSNSEGSPEYKNNAACTWTISGLEARVMFGSFDIEAGYDYVHVDECFDAECTRLGASLAVLDGTQEPGQRYESSTSHLRVRFTSDLRTTKAGFTARVYGEASGCSPCKAGTFRASTDASGCTPCPTNAVSVEGSSSCECPAGYTGDAGLGVDCVECKAGTYKDVSGSADCLACPRGTFKPDGPGACVSCPGDLTSAEGASRCICKAGEVFIVPSLSCSGSCPCSPQVVLNQSTIFSNSEGNPVYENNASCTWTISGVNPQVTFDSFKTEMFDYVHVDECFDAACTRLGASLGSWSGEQEPGQMYESSKSHLRLCFTSDGIGVRSGFTATVSGGSSGCTLCEAGTYTAATDALGCTACPPNAISAEGSTALSSCECPAGYAGDAGVGEDCVACDANTYKDVRGSTTCTACPSHAVSLLGSTELSSCFCPGGYTGDAGLGASCLACETGTFKTLGGPGACLSCPGDAKSAEGASSCACGAGHSFKDFVPSVTCDEDNPPECTCTPSVGVSGGVFHQRAGSGKPWGGCSWIISGAAPRVSVTSMNASAIVLIAHVNYILNDNCIWSGWEYQSSAARLRVRFQWYGYGSDAYFAGEWNTSSKPPECSPCEAGTYQAATNASECTACPTNAVSTAGSSSCKCPVGYTGDAGVGEGCVACEACTYKDVSGPVTCTACPSNAVSLLGSTGLSSCFCPAGYAGDAGLGARCVACEAGTFKPFDGPGPCLACPWDAASAEGASSCACGAGHFVSYVHPGASGCTTCPTNAVSAEGSSSCECRAGYTGDAGLGEDCVACEAGTHKDVSGSAACKTLTGPKKRPWMHSSTGFFLDGPLGRAGFGCAEAGGKVYLFGGSDSSGEHLCSRPEHPVVSVSTVPHRQRISCCSWSSCSIRVCCVLASGGGVFLLDGFLTILLHLAGNSLTDTWIFDPVEIEWTDLSKMAAGLGSTPPPRQDFGMASADGIIFLFGGLSSDRTLRGRPSTFP